MLDSAGSESSSSEKLEGESPPPAVKEKSCGSFGCESAITRIWPWRWLVKVHVTVSPGLTEMFEIGLPSLQVALSRLHPAGTDSATE